MKFTHMADCHIGAWRDPKLKELNLLAFKKAIEISLKEKVEFILIAGDLFNTALPGIDKLKDVVRILKDLKDKDVPVYLIPGSHDFSPSGKTMLDVLEEAGLVVNVVKGSVKDNKLSLKFTEDRSGAKITGLLGKRGMLERSYYEGLDRNFLEKEPGFKVFMFHTALTELKPKKLEKMDSSPISLLPKGFDYYAGGHVHIVENKSLPGYKNVVYPGPLFPNSFHELEELEEGGFYIYDDSKIIRKTVKIKPIRKIFIDAEHKVPENITSELIGKIDKSDLDDALVLIRVRGLLESGKIAEIDFRKAYDIAYEKGAYFVMRNTSKLSTQEYEEIKIEAGKDIEAELIDEHAGQFKVEGWDAEKEKSMITQLMAILSSDKKEGEKVYEFESRIMEELRRILEI